ncbi:MAG: hypothetical protein AAFN92_09410, partial [Bacteroidota bacterium]
MKTLFVLAKVSLFVVGYLALGYSLGKESLLTKEVGPLERALQRVDEQFRDDLDRFDATLATYAEKAANDRTAVTEIRQLHTQARRDFKKVEHLLAYIDPTTVNLHL